MTTGRPGMRPPAYQYQPPRNGPCLCGSGQKFKRCCADRLPGASGLGIAARKLRKERKYNEALKFCRADITQYTIWHKSHTEPVVRLGAPQILPLLKTDIGALSELVDKLFDCYRNTDSIKEFPAVLERLRTNISDARWHRKITYFQALYALWPNWNEEKGRAELLKLGSVEEETDAEILQLYLDLFDSSLSFAEKQQLTDRIIEFSPSDTDKLHYRSVKAILYVMIGDLKAAEKEFTEAIQAFRSKHSDDDLNTYQCFRLGMSLEFLGSLRRDQTQLAEAIKLFSRALGSGDLNPKGTANLWRQIGDTHKHRSDWTAAAEAYAQAIAILPAPIYEVLRSECFLRMNKLAEAISAIEKTQNQVLEGPERVDYAFALAAIAIEGSKRGLLDRAKDVLQNLEVHEPYFRERRDSFLLNVMEAINSGPSKSLTARTRELLATIAKATSSYLVLQPNIMGIGVDINKALQDFSKSVTPRGKRTEKPPKEEK